MIQTVDPISPLALKQHAKRGLELITNPAFALEFRGPAYNYCSLLHTHTHIYIYIHTDIACVHNTWITKFVVFFGLLEKARKKKVPSERVVNSVILTNVLETLLPGVELYCLRTLQSFVCMHG